MAMLQTQIRRSPSSKMVLLAPASLDVHADFPTTTVNAMLHTNLLQQMQSLRSHVYLQDGAITEREVTSDGRHALEIDHFSWHLLTVTPEGRVTGCVRYTEHSPGTPFELFNAHHCALAHSDVWGLKVRTAV